MDRKQREERRRQEDIALQRGLLWVAGAIVLEALLVLVNRYYINYRTVEAEVNIALALSSTLRFLRIAAPIASLLALAWAGWSLKQKKKFGLPLILAFALAAIAICAHVVFKFQGPGISMLFWLVVAWAVLALVYYIYQREFFLAASACGMSVLSLWFVRYGAVGRLEAILLLIAIALVTGGVVWLKKTDGLWPGTDPIRFLAQKTNYTVPVVTCAASLAAVIAAMVLGSTAAFYLIFVMVAWLFALFVYFTVKLM